MSSVRGVVLVLVGVLGLVGCTPREVEPTPTPVGFESGVVCGADRGAIEMVTGRKISRREGALSVQDGVGSGRCEVWSNEEAGELFVVEMWPATSVEATDVRNLFEGRGGNAPSLMYDPAVADGGVWYGEDYPGSGGVSNVFWGDTMIKVAFGYALPGRDAPADLLAMTHQVADTYGLERPDPTS